MTAATITPVPTDVLTAVRAFLLAILPAGTPVIQGIQNRVAMPVSGFVLMTPLYQMRLATNVDSYDDTYPSSGASFSAEQDTRIDIQLDFYGPLSGAWAAMISTLWRDEYGVTALAPNCAPLYIDDARMMPLTDDEQQYLQRWMSVAVAQYNPVVTLPQQFAGAAEATLIDVDVVYPP
jgi:hypothetical protein